MTDEITVENVADPSAAPASEAAPAAPTESAPTSEAAPAAPEEVPESPVDAPAAAAPEAPEAPPAPPAEEPQIDEVKLTIEIDYHPSRLPVGHRPAPAGPATVDTSTDDSKA